MRASTSCVVALVVMLGVVGEAAAENNSSAAPLISADVSAASTPVTTATTATKYDAVLNTCGPMHSADQAPANIERDNVLDPISNVAIYLHGRGILIDGMSGPGEFDPNQFKIKVLKSPAHGELRDGIYHANAGYLGIDQIVFDVEVLGKKLKVIETLVIHNSGNLDYPTDAAKALFDKACPKDKGSSRDIIERRTSGSDLTIHISNVSPALMPSYSLALPLIPMSQRRCLPAVSAG